MSITHHIRNYYEQLVADEILQRVGNMQGVTSDYMADVACVALNHLPPRYIRYEVDMAFYMSPDELNDIQERVSQCVTDALQFVDQHKRDLQA
ncbi:competence protein ComFB [Bacterioplanes sanyensis]|uniref:Competence protein ComFB n=1 Tax=Bacterioplanes sanyensis TaxID=1249553 RepID=A0A222FHQ8_9GAMM|nr:late competence development ComFB family protein [Bacterioplanes sanyensis]ASP38300.1 competence protein ComFB [Bacterioplanes sanyensis]